MGLFDGFSKFLNHQTIKDAGVCGFVKYFNVMYVVYSGVTYLSWE